MIFIFVISVFYLSDVTGKELKYDSKVIPVYETKQDSGVKSDYQSAVESFYTKNEWKEDFNQIYRNFNEIEGNL